MGKHEALICDAFFEKLIEIFLSHIKDNNKLKNKDFLFFRFDVSRLFWFHCKTFLFYLVQCFKIFQLKNKDSSLITSCTFIPLYTLAHIP